MYMRLLKERAEAAKLPVGFMNIEVVVSLLGAIKLIFSSRYCFALGVVNLSFCYVYLFFFHLISIMTVRIPSGNFHVKFTTPSKVCSRVQNNKN